MAWHEIIGHENVIERFRRSVRSGRLASTYLFVGPEGIGKRTFALKLGQALLCERSTAELDPCGSCLSCQQAIAQTHPDLLCVSKPEDRNSIPVELFIGDREHRRREGLCHDISLTPFYGRRKIAIIDDADFLNAEGANCLLKTLEEPPPSSLLILIGTSEHRQLPTILSRSQVTRFRSLTREQLISVLNNQALGGDVPLAQIVAAADGSVQRAMRLDDRGLYEFRQQLLNQLSSADPAAGGYAKSVVEFVDGVSKEASVRRECLRLISDFALQLYRQSLLNAANPDGADHNQTDVQQPALRLIAHINLNEQAVAELLADCIDRTEAFQKQIAANLSTANMVPAWLNDLGAIARREKSMA